MTGTIYAVKDPESGVIVYVGRTTLRPDKRWSGHMSASKARWGRRTPLYRWMRNLQSPPKFEVLLTGVPRAELLKFELVAMDIARRINPGLLNVHYW